MTSSAQVNWMFDVIDNALDRAFDTIREKIDDVTIARFLSPYPDLLDAWNEYYSEEL